MTAHKVLFPRHVLGRASLRYAALLIMLAACRPALTRPGQAPAGGVASVAGPPAVTAFVDVAVIPMDREWVLLHQTVVVRGARIVALGPAQRVRVPAGATRIDGRDKFLIPGLADMHAHLLQPPGQEDTTGAELERWLYVYVANGVTTLRTMGFQPRGPRILVARTRAARGELISPRLYVAAGPGGDRAAVAMAKDSGYDLFKMYYEGIGSQLDSEVATAHRLGIPIAGHPPLFAESPEALPRAIAAGFASVEHLAGFDVYLGVSHGFWWEFWNDSTRSPAQARRLLADSAKLRAIAAEFHRAGVWNCPTLAMYDATLLAADTWPELRYLQPPIGQALRDKQHPFPQPAQRPAAQAAVEVRRAIVRALHEAGAGLLLGTDTPAPFMVPGFSVHRELEALVRAGLTPYEALLTGTRNVAAYFGTLDSAGTVTVGKRADLVLLNGNPLEDIRQTMTPAGVLLNGRWLDRATLDRGLAAFEGMLFGFPPQ